MNEIKLIFRNSFYNIFGQLLPLIVGFVSIPFLIKNLGIERFGLLSLIWVFLGYLAFFDLGFSRAIIKIIAEELAREKTEEVPNIIWTATWIVGFLSALGCLILTFLAEFLATRVFQIPQALHSESILAIKIIALSLPLVTLIAVFKGVLEAQQRFFAANVLQTLSGTMTYFVPFVICFFTPNIVYLILGISITRFMTLIANILVCSKNIPQLLVPRWIDKDSFKKLLSFGSWLTVSNIISPLMVYFDRFILGSLIPVGNLAYYTTPYEIVTRVLILPSAVARVLFPTFSSAIAVQNNEEAKLHSEAIRILSLVLLPVTSVLILFADNGLHLWLGKNFSSESTLILQIFAIGIFFNGIANVPYTFIQSANRPDLTAKIHLAEFPIYIGLLWYMTLKFGLLGAATAWSFRLIFDFFLLEAVSHKMMKQPMSVMPHVLKLSFVILASFLVGQITNLPLYCLVFIWFFIILIIWAFFLSAREKRILLGGSLAAFDQEFYQNTNQSCLAIVVSYNPGEHLIEFVQKLLVQFDEVLIIDNKSENESLTYLNQAKDFGCKIIYNTENLGIASALNQGFRYAKNKYEWVCTFDQDSNIPEDYRIKLFASLISHPEKNKVAVIGPQIFEMNLNKSVPYSWLKNARIFEVPTVITSGSLIRLSAFEVVGGFNERLFIDYVDHEFSLKLRSKGYMVTLCSDTQLYHKLGHTKSHRLFFREFFSSHHDALRRYYNTRNRFYVYFKYLVFEPVWVIQDFYYFIKEMIKILLVERDKKRKFKSVILGLADCARHRFGKRNSM
jgi:O-antigen/teichoic acid export membrane protein/GT2 family glycosyltransferase